jgi:hypothetical protein
VTEYKALAVLKFKGKHMARVHEEVIVIKLSRLVKDGAEVDSAVSEELLATLTTVAEELVGSGVVVEAEAAQ